VQALPSSHGWVEKTWVHPKAGSQESVVHEFKSSQEPLMSAYWHPSALSHESVVQAFESSHETAWYVHPTALLHESVVQALESSQSTGLPGRQAPPEQASSEVHALASSQGSVLLV